VRERIRIIGNPISGRGKAARRMEALAALLRRRGCAVEVLQTRQAGDARRFAGDADGVSAIACVGGDGTVNEVVNGLPLGKAPPLSMIPCGTANVLAKELGLPSGLDALARVLTDGREVRWDLGVDRVSGRRFLLFGSAGYDAHVVHVFHAARKGPIAMWQYVLWGLKSVLGYEVPAISVEVDGRPVAKSAAWVTVSNVASYGGPLVFTPHARVDDGVFEVMVLRSRWKRDTVRMFFAAICNYCLRMDYPLVDVDFVKGKRVTVRSACRVPVQIDGDPAGHLPADFEIVPGGISILAPLR
jgi:YegS/Rv2252/BmrU family lipid kinase